MKRLTSSFLVFIFLLSAVPAVLAEEKEGFKVTFVADGHAIVDVYDTQDYTAPSGENVAFAYARDSESGQIDISGDGQVNFKVKAEEGYEIASYYVDEMKFDHYPHLDNSVRKRRMNIALVCDILNWGYKNSGLLDKDGFNVPLKLDEDLMGEAFSISDSYLEALDKE